MVIRKIPQGLLRPAFANTHPSFIRWGLYRAMTYRHEPPPFNKNTRVCVAFCDELWIPESPGSVANIPITKNGGGDEVVEDCRLFMFNGHVHFTVTNRNRIGIGCSLWEGPCRFSWVSVADHADMEKNWQFFEHAGELYGIRWVVPHEVYHIKLDYKNGHHAEKAYVDDRKWDWNFGVIHGGTSPVRYGNVFVSMFHSFTIGFPPYEGRCPANEKKDESERKVNFAAPYMFEADPPFRIIMVPAEPMIWPRIQQIDRRSPNKDYVVFPTGLIQEGNQWLCGYGDDRYCFQCWFDNNEMMELLTPL